VHWSWVFSRVDVINFYCMNFLEKLYDANNSLSMLLLEAKPIAEEYDDKSLIDLINNEISGYEIADEIPEYRKIRAEIVADISNVYGQEYFKEKFVDFSLLSKKVGLDLEIAYCPDGIAFLENAIKLLTKSTALKQIPQNLVKMLDETFHFNNPELHITKAYYKMPTASVKYILEKVRQDLIISFQKLSKGKKKSDFVLEGSIEAKFSKTIFVTYAWENDLFNSQIISFVNFLRQLGFDASMDRKKSQEESSLNLNRMMVEGIQNSDKVIVVLTEKYREKADRFEGGVGMEYQLILEGIKKNLNKYILVSFGNAAIESIVPTGLKGRIILDLKKDQDENNFNELTAKIKEENIIEFTNVSMQEVLVNKHTIEPFKL
jgi:hypothetical protein